MESNLPEPTFYANRRKSNIKKAQIEYNKMTSMPTLERPIRYPVCTTSSVATARSSFHDLIHSNLNALVPNIGLAVHTKQYTITQLADWTKTSTEYGKYLFKDYQEKCDRQFTILLQIASQQAQSNCFNIANVTQLPNDILTKIKEYLLPESHVDLLLNKYPNIEKDFLILKSKHLNKLQALVYENYYMPFYYSTDNDAKNKLSCLTPLFGLIRNTFKNKSHSISQIMQVLKEYKNAKPRTLECHTFFQTKTLILLKLIVYLIYHKNKKQVKPVKPVKPVNPVKPIKIKKTKTPK
jgi:hypothetical protein